MSRPALLPAALTGLALAAAGCGGRSAAPPVASLATSSSTATTPTSTVGGTTKAIPVAFARCMTSHGFAASLGSAANASGRTLSIAGVVIPGADPSSPQFQAAMQACRTYLPSGGPPTMTPAQQAEWARAMAQFAACMRRHGVPGFPDPTGQGRFSPGSLEQIGPSSPIVGRAFTTCRSLEPKVGPRIGFG